MTAPAAADARISAPVFRACIARSPSPSKAAPAARGLEIDRLSADHAARPGGVGDDADRAQLARRPVAVRRLARHQRERLGQQAVAGEDRQPLAEHDVAGRPAAPQRVVVHGRQVVVDEGVGVDELERAGGRQRQRARRARRRRRSRCATASAAASASVGRRRLPPANRL